MSKLLLIITGSIAATKSLDVIQLLRERGVEVTCVLTQSAQEFVSVKACEEASGNKAYTDLFAKGDEMAHINLSRESDLIAVVPASADFLAKMKYGFADNLALALILAADKQVVVVPAMNVKMWEHPATQRNVCQLKKDGVAFLGPTSGVLACGEEGEGRMIEPDEIVRELEKFLAGGGDRRGAWKSLSGIKALVTTGPTIEAIDPVRYITNRSSGKQGHAIAQALYDAGADVTLVTGPTSLPDLVDVVNVRVESAQEMLDACEQALPVDVAVCAAAVADWGVHEVAEQKIKKSRQKEDFTLTFAENPDILAAIAQHEKRPDLVIGFAAETESVVAHAKEKLEKKGVDWIVANDVSEGKVFDQDENEVHVLRRDGEETWPPMDKEHVAEKLTEQISAFFHPSTLKEAG